ncbi:MAG: type II toxin-antitoxin system VapC family toxin [Thermoplasmata archaeon]|nr:type II toxin-antitoxin system VapC family toxin [Thermoplasmata archaeon]
MSLYVDSNIFVFAAADNGVLGERCRGIVELINGQKISCASSFLVLDEVLWVLKRLVGKENAIRITRAMASLPIRWIDVDEQVMIRMMEIYEETGLDPRDSLHVSSMREVGLSVILSEDRDFDGVEGIERMDASACMERYG